MIKIAFISIHIRKSPLSFPLSSAVLASAVDNDLFLENRTETLIMDYFLSDNLSYTAEKIIESGTDIAAFSVYLWNRDYILNLVRILKEKKPGISVIAGGAEVTADPEFFSSIETIDWIVNGEGEEAVTEYLRTVIKNMENSSTENSSNINKVNIKSGNKGRTVSSLNKKLTISDTAECGSLFSYSERKSVYNPDNFPSPFLDKKINLGNYDGILWELSRGCPFRCSFCFESRGSSKVRNISLERIEKELDLIKHAGIDQIFVLDPTFNIDIKRAKKILSLIKKKAPDIHFTFEARSEYIDRETARLFSEITCSIQIGLQSSSPYVLKNVNRKFDPDDFFNKILLLHEEGAVYGFDIIYGLPGDTLETFLESIDYALSMQPNHLDIFPLAVLKGTELYDKAEEFGLIYKNEDPYTVIRTPGFPEEDLKKAEQTAYALDIFYNKGEAVSFLPLLLENLDLKPSIFFRLFSQWLYTKENNIILTDFESFSDSAAISASSSGPDIILLQTDFVRKLFSEKGMGKEGELASDIILCLGNNDNFSGLFDLDKVFEYLDSGITDLNELVFFTEITS